MKILAFQPDIGPSVTSKEKEKYVGKIIKKLEFNLDSILEAPPDIVFLPELSTIEYSRNAFERLDELAEGLDGFTFQCFSEIAKKYGVYISFGMPRLSGEKYYISNIVVNNSGQLVSYYDKLHIAQFGASEEKDFFDRGNSISIFELEGFTIGVVICYDFRFGEYISHLVGYHGVNFIIHPVAFTADKTFASWHHFVITRALENQIYFLSLNRAGDQWGNSIFCPPWIDGTTLPEVFGKKEDFRIFDLTMSDLAKSREQYTFSCDKLDTYKNLERT